MLLQARLPLATLVVCSLTTVAAADELTAVTTPRQPKLSVATDPIGLVSGLYALSATYVLTHRFALRANVEVTEDPWAYGSSSWRAGISVPIYLDRPLHGPYLEPGLAMTERLVGYAAVGGIGMVGSDPGSGGFGSLGGYTAMPIVERSIEPQIFVGWQWLFDSGLNLAAAIGVSRHLASDGSGTSASIPESYLRVGIAL